MTTFADKKAREHGRFFARSEFSGKDFDPSLFDRHVDFVVRDKVEKQKIQFSALHLQVTLNFKKCPHFDVIILSF